MLFLTIDRNNTELCSNLEAAAADNKVNEGGGVLWMLTQAKCCYVQSRIIILMLRLK